MIIIKTPEEIEILREGGKRLSEVLNKVKAIVMPGISTKDLDRYAEKLIREMGDTPAFLNYRPAGAKTSFPASLCVSVNDEVVHGIPHKNKILKEGDVVSIDLGIKHKNLFTDMAMTVPVGNINASSEKLLEVTKKALEAGINEARVGNTIGDISYAIQRYIKSQGDYGIVEELAGHGVGRAIHEEPYVPNFGKKGTGAKLVKGMVIAIEPMVNSGTRAIVVDADDWTIRTADGKKSAHFEHTVLITNSDPEILTNY